MTDDTTHFGYETVPLSEKQARVDDVFHSVAQRYDVMNDLMSVGLHRLWKSNLVSMLRPPKSRVFRHLDVAGGTGDVAFRVKAAGGPLTQVTVADINGGMLGVGRERAEALGHSDIAFVEANAEALPFGSGIYDGYTIAFGIRNVTRIEAALAEAYRVLRPGGRFLCLEFSRVTLPGFDRAYDAYSLNVLPLLGRVVAGDAASCRYLAESIRRFPDQETFAGLIRAAGFGQVRHRNLSGGIAAIHSGWRL